MSSADETQKNKAWDQSVDSVPLYRKKRVAVTALVSIVITVSAAIYFYLSSSRVVSTDDAYVDANRVTVSSKYAGKVAQLMVDEGDKVTRGQVLARLDDSDLNAQEAQARAALAFAQKTQELAKVNLEKSQEDFDRAQVQFSSDIIPKEQYDHAKKALEAGKAQASIADAQVATAKAQLGIVQTQLQNIVITAPMDGVIAKRWVLPGDVVQVAQPMLTVYDQEHVWITANLEETKFSQLKLNQEVMISFDSYHGKTFKGNIVQLGANTASQFSLIPPNNASGNFTKITQRIPIKIGVKQGAEPLLPGMSAEIRIKVRT